MTRNKKHLIAKFLLVFAALPIAIYGYSEGPDAFRTGAPGDAVASHGSGTCLDSGCHSGPALNAGGGSVKIILQSGTTYTPGVKQRIMVQILDAAKQKFGFELTARLASNITAGQAGDFTTADGLTQILCADGGPKPVKGCAASVSLQFIEHSVSGYNASTSGGYTYQFDWTPPTTNVGNVTLYVAANAGPGGLAVQTGANVYTTNVTLTPSAVVVVTTPSITPGGVVPVYSSSTTVQPGSWFSVYGNNLTAATTLWNGDFPASLGGTTVTVNGKNAYLWFVSSGQINAQAPDDTATGSVPVVVTSTGATATTTITLAPAGPSFLLLPDAKHATGIILTPDNSGSQAGGTYDLLGPTTAGAGFRAAKKGENVAIYAVGFGPTIPAVPAGKIYSGAAPAVVFPQVTLGGVPLTVDFAGIVGAGLYQLNFKIPANMGSGDLTLAATANGLQTQASIVIPVQ
jgi:uncharacterized protein (TIGR03437 family)